VKQVLIIDESPLFREYLRVKLVNNGLPATVAVNGLDGITKMRGLNPDLIIMDDCLGRQGPMDVLRQKQQSPTTAPIPVILLAREMDQKKLLELVPYNVKKVFTKPVKIDGLLSTLSQMTGARFNVDESPGIVEVHVNDNIIFVEIAQGLNRDKIELLGYKIIELSELYKIQVPKVIVLMSDIKLDCADGPNLQKLLNVVLRSSRANPKYVRVLTHDGFAREFIESRNEYNGIQVENNLQNAVDGLLAEIKSGINYGELKAEIIGEKLLSAEEGGEETMQLRYEGDETLTVDDMKETLANLRVAVVDDDLVIQGIIKNAFTKVGSEVFTYSDGDEFTRALGGQGFDLVFLDILMPKMDGFAVLENLKTRALHIPIIVLSAVTQRDTVIKAFQMGVKSYLTKPLKPDSIFKKSMEILKVNY
jgi:CheY-like chemotaxis protein